MFGHVFELLYSKIVFCGSLLPGIGQWPSLEVLKGFEEYGVVACRCECNIPSSEVLEFY